MISHRINSVAILAFVALCLNACSGGSEGTGNNDDGGGTDTVSFGAVTQLGSVYVNDVHYTTSNASIRVDDNPGSESDLKVGQTAVVSGSISDDGINGTASSVTVESVVKGPVDSEYNASTRELGVLGQTVQVTALTVIDDSLTGGVEGLTLGDEIKVHGHVRGNGIIEATLIENANVALTEYKVIGLAQTVGADSFMIGGLNINYNGADTSDLSGGAPTAGQLVEVKGSTTLNAGSLMATKVEPAGISNGNISYVEIEGFVTQFTSSSAFTVGNIPVVTTASTIYEGGLPEDITLGSKLEVDGQLSNGTLTASKVQFRYNIKLEGDVSTYDGSSLTVTGLDGVTVQIDGLTELDGTPVVNGHVRIRGYQTNSAVTATRVEDRGNSDARTILQAPVESEIPGTSVSLLSITVNTTSGGFEFRDVNDMVLSSDAFYNLIEIGTLVKARGDYNGSIVVWDQAEVED